jgi:hypothetical protein
VPLSWGLLCRQIRVSLFADRDAHLVEDFIRLLQNGYPSVSRSDVGDQSKGVVMTNGTKARLPKFAAEYSLQEIRKHYAEFAHPRKESADVHLAENCSGGGCTCKCEGRCARSPHGCDCLPTVMAI